MAYVSIKLHHGDIVIRNFIPTLTTNAKIMKFILSIILLIFLSLSSCKTLKQNDAKAEVYFKINPEKTYADNIGGIMLNFNIINNSKEDIVILKPNNTYNSRIDFFSNTMECEDIPIWESDAGIEHLEVNDKDYLTIKSKTSAELLMNGRSYGWLACNSDSVQIKIKYEPFKIIDEEDQYINEKKQIMGIVSNIKIYSHDVKFKLNK